MWKQKAPQQQEPTAQDPEGPGRPLELSGSRDRGQPAGQQGVDGEGSCAWQELQLLPKQGTDRLGPPISLTFPSQPLAPPPTWLPSPRTARQCSQRCKHELYTQTDQGSRSGSDPYNYLCGPEQATSLAFLSLCFLISNVAIASWYSCGEN